MKLGKKTSTVVHSGAGPKKQPVERSTELVARDLRDRDARVNSKQNRLDRLTYIINERARDSKMAQIPGGDSGLLIRRDRFIGSGESTRVVASGELDIGLLREMRDLEREAAQELGQWPKKGDDSEFGDGPISESAVSLAELLAPEELEALKADLLALQKKAQHE